MEMCKFQNMIVQATNILKEPSSVSPRHYQ